eukprot:191614-Chlamydomonas_euryale.AAC.6
MRAPEACERLDNPPQSRRTLAPVAFLLRYECGRSRQERQSRLLERGRVYVGCIMSRSASAI